jgi:hypothetical protein
VSTASAGPVGERRNLRLRRLRDTVAARYGVPPAALAALDGSTVMKMAALQERRLLHFRIERAGVPPSESDATAGLVSRERNEGRTSSSR